MEYIDIDSTYRDRIRFPNQADFDLTHQQHHICCPTDQLINPVSCQTIIYPNPQEFSQVAFFEESIKETYGAMVETWNLPLMYSTDNDNVVQLDELVIYSTDPTTREIQANSLYPRNAVPLGENNEFYTGYYLEDVLNNESRQIIFYRFDDTNSEAIYQSGVVLNTSTIGTQFSVYVDTQALNTPLSNIDRFYQGKYLKITSGTASGSSRLIVDYIPSTSASQFILESDFGKTIVAGTEFQIVLDRKYYVTISSPFTNALPTYPSYREPIEETAVAFNSQIIATFSDPAEFVRISNQEIGSGVAVVLVNGNLDGASNPLADVVYVSSVDNGTLGWNTPVNVFSDVYAQDIGLEVSDFSSALDVPQVIYAIPQASTPNPANANPLFIRINTSLSTDGQYGWQITAGEDVEATATTQPLTPTTPPFKGTTINSVSRREPNGEITIFVSFVLYNAGNFAEIYFSYLTSGGAITTTLIYTHGVAGEIIHIYHMDIIQGNPAIFYLRNSAPYYVFSTTTDGSSLPLDTHYLLNAFVYDPTFALNTYALDLHLTTLNVNGVDVPVALSARGAMGSSIQRLIMNVSPNATGEITPWNTNQIWFIPSQTSGLRTARIWQGIYRGQPVVILLGCRDNIGLQMSVTFDNPFIINSPFSDPEVLDDSNVRDLDIIDDNSGGLVVVYTRQSKTDPSQYQLVTLHMNEVELGIARPYRIREEPAYATGVSTILDATTRTITLPASLQQSSDSLYVNSYIHVYSPNIYTIPSPFGMYNDFRMIRAYDPVTNTITLDRPLSYEPDPYGLPSVGPSALYLPTLSLATLGNDDSGNSYDFTIQANAQYVSSYTDTNGLTINNLLYVDGTPNSGLDRNISADTNITTPLTTATNLAGNIQYSVGFWFLLNNLATDQNILVLYDSVTPTIMIRFYYNSVSGFFEVEHPTLGGVVAQYTIQSDTWYNVAWTQEKFFINNVLQVGEGYLQALYTPTDIYIGQDNLGANRMDGYFKNLVFTPALWYDQEVENIYNNGLNNYTYALAFELLTCVTDNYNPLDYNNTMVLNQNPQCYAVELTHLTLPNVLLKSGFGNRIAFYPYVYVVFESIDTHTTAKLYSNNPAVNKNRVIFKVPIRDTSTPDRAFFVNNYSGMTQIMKFKPSDNFHFKVLMYNGELFETSASDTLPPLQPDPLLQISATIGFRRIPANQVQM